MNFVVDIMKKNMEKSDPLLPLYMMLAIFQAFIPLVVHRIMFGHEDNFFQSDYQMYGFYVIQIPQFMFNLLNMILLGALKLFYDQKIKFKLAVLSALDDEFKLRFVDYTNSQLPVIPLSDP